MPSPRKGNPSKNLGKNQELVINLLIKEGPLFQKVIINELVHHFESANGYSNIYDALKRLIDRGILSKTDEKAKCVEKGLKYAITEKGKNLLNLELKIK